MVVRRQAFVVASALTAGLAAAEIAHAPKRVTGGTVSVDSFLPPQRSAPDLARANRHLPTPWPTPFAKLDEYVDGEPERTPRRPYTPPRRAKRLVTAVQKDSSPDDPVLAAATPYTLPGPIIIEPSPYMMPPRPPRYLPPPVTDPLGFPKLDDPPPAFPPPALTAIPPTFPYGLNGTDPLALDTPIFGSPGTLDIPVGTTSVPEPSTLAALLLVPQLLGRQRRRA